MLLAKRRLGLVPHNAFRVLIVEYGWIFLTCRGMGLANGARDAEVSYFDDVYLDYRSGKFGHRLGVLRALRRRSRL